MPETRTNDDIKKIVEKVSKALIKNENFVKCMVNQIVQEVSASYEEKFTEVKKEVIVLQDENEKLNKKIDFLEQNTKMNKLRILGVPEDENLRENCTDKLMNIFNNRLKLNLTANDIYKLYRIRTNANKSDSGNNVNKKPGPIIVEFYQRNVKNLVFKNKKNLKSSGIIIHEDLTRIRYNLWKKTATAFGIKNVWTVDGMIYASLDNKKTIIVRKSDDISANLFGLATVEDRAASDSS